MIPLCGIKLYIPIALTPAIRMVRCISAILLAASFYFTLASASNATEQQAVSDGALPPSRIRITPKRVVGRRKSPKGKKRKLSKKGGGWTVESGACMVEKNFGTACVLSPNYPRQYGNKQKCVISLKGRKKTVVFSQFDTETWFDTLTIDGVKFSGNKRPKPCRPKKNIVWSSDFWNLDKKKGWKMCNRGGGMPKLLGVK
mmetsp:Transcript_4562/g.9086  ORF Transcript_4562/g.9086 Transcript_4562/m.9086 type:complete len:200 (+) Transcript_4562:2-601(+)